jgi:hypothetical protein
MNLTHTYKYKKQSALVYFAKAFVKQTKRTFSLILTGRAVKEMPLQKLSTRRAMPPLSEICTFSPWTEWKLSGGKLLVVTHPPELEPATQKRIFE